MWFKNFFKATKDDTVPIAIRDAFTVASSRYDQSQEAVQSYTVRARNRAQVYRRAWPRYQQTKDAEAFQKEIAACTDPADLYTEAKFDAYTVKMENLSADFDVLTAAFAALSSATQNTGDEFYVTARTHFNLYCEYYKMAADVYKMAVGFAGRDASVAVLQGIQDDAKAWMQELQINPDAEVRKTEGRIRAELFQEKVKIAETKAEAFLARVKEVLGE